MFFPTYIITKTLCFYFDDLGSENCSKLLKIINTTCCIGSKIPESLNLKQIKELSKKEKNLCNQIHLDYKKISEKMNYDFNRVKQLKFNSFFS